MRDGSGPRPSDVEQPCESLGGFAARSLPSTSS